ncbi:Ankyrin repeat-containing protein [Hirschfeldia incana]|nr:Ankyrin repeat-containing protein [Hirschfeldia incana]
MVNDMSALCGSDANKRGALHFAARKYQTEICRYLVEEMKPYTNTKDKAGDTPLVHAARQRQIEMAKYLIDHGADPNIGSELGATALHHAAGTGEIEMLKEWLSRGVPVDSQSESGTPLIWAVGHDQKDTVQVLLEHNANPNADTGDDVRPLLSAVAAGAKANVFAGGATLLHIAVDIGDLELINCLLKVGAHPNQKDEEGNRPLEVAALRENRKIFETLFPSTTKSEYVLDWLVDGVIAHMESNKEQEDNSNKAKYGEAGIKKDLPEFSNRSICWLRLGQAEFALSDAKACRELKPDRPKASFREGAALRLLHRFDEAANAFYEGVFLSPENKEPTDTFRESVDAGRNFHGKDKITHK